MNKKPSIIDESFDMEPLDYEMMTEDNNLPSTIILAKEDPSYDEKDVEIEQQYQDVYNKAMTAFDDQTEAALDIEGKFLARNSEVANQLLTTALSAAKLKADLKKHTDHRKIKAPAAGNQPGTVNNTQNVFMDRNEILKIIGQQDS